MSKNMLYEGFLRISMFLDLKKFYSKVSVHAMHVTLSQICSERIALTQKLGPPRLRDLASRNQDFIEVFVVLAFKRFS